jgi:hypothetical protein
MSKGFFEIYTVNDKIKSVADNWERQYLSYPPDHKQKEKGKKLRALINPTKEQIDLIIGNTSWTEINCDSCEIEVDTVVRIKGRAYDEYGSTDLCKSCALEIIEAFKKIG